MHIPQRFAAKFTKDPGGCWLWTAAVLPGSASNLPGDRGYGQYYHNGRPRPAHRVAWTFVHGPIPPGKLVCHKCDIRSCVNPDHMYLGDPCTNAQDAVNRQRGIGAPEGTRHGNAKLDEAAVLDIRTRAETQRVYMARYDVSRTTVSNVQNGKVWAWVGKRDPKQAMPSNVVPHQPRRKLTDADVTAIRASDEKHQTLADRYGVSASYISMLRAGIRRRSTQKAPVG